MRNELADLWNKFDFFRRLELWACLIEQDKKARKDMNSVGIKDGNGIKWIIL